MNLVISYMCSVLYTPNFPGLWGHRSLVPSPAKSMHSVPTCYDSSESITASHAERTLSYAATYLYLFIGIRNNDSRITLLQKPGTSQQLDNGRKGKMEHDGIVIKGRNYF